MPNSESETNLNRKNMKSNVHLQPLNYKTSNPPPPGVPNVATGIEEILKNHHIHINPSDQVYGQQQIPMKKSQLAKLTPAIAQQQIQLNLNPSDSSGTMNGGNTFQMSI